MKIKQVAVSYIYGARSEPFINVWVGRYMYPNLIPNLTHPFWKEERESRKKASHDQNKIVLQTLKLKL